MSSLLKIKHHKHNSNCKEEVCIDQIWCDYGGEGDCKVCIYNDECYIVDTMPREYYDLLKDLDLFKTQFILAVTALNRCDGYLRDFYKSRVDFYRERADSVFKKIKEFENNG